MRGADVRSRKVTCCSIRVPRATTTGAGRDSGVLYVLKLASIQFR